MVIPVGGSEVQMLKIMHKDSEGSVSADDYGECLFVPLIGDFGWPESPGSENA
jgi:protein-L-isoaspartate O-methyltransferase